MAFVWRDRIDEIALKIESLKNSVFGSQGVRAYPDHEACAMAGDEPNWDRLTKGQQRAVMERYVGWRGFDPSDIEHTIKNVISGRPSHEWFVGVNFHGMGAEKNYREWVADEKNAARAAVRRLNLMRKSEDPDYPGNPLRIRVSVKWENLTPEQQKELIVYLADKGHKLFSSEYGNMRQKLIERELQRITNGKEEKAQEVSGPGKLILKDDLDGKPPEPWLEGTRTLHDILHGDHPKQQEVKTQERDGGREI